MTRPKGRQPTVLVAQRSVVVAFPSNRNQLGLIGTLGVRQVRDREIGLGKVASARWAMHAASNHSLYPSLARPLLLGT